MIEEKEIIACGRFFRTHALKGELNAVCENVDAGILDEGYPVIMEMDGIFVPFFVEGMRPKGQFRCLVKLEGIDSVERAQEFVNREFYLLRRDVAEYEDIDEEDVMTEDQFKGWRVEVENTGYVGRVSHIDSTTANLLLVVKPDDDDDEILIPFNDEFVKDIREGEEPDAASKGTILLSLPEGIMDLNRK